MDNLKRKNACSPLKYLAVHSSGKVNKPEFVGSVPGFCVLKKGGIVKVDIIFHHDNGMEPFHIKEPAVFSSWFFHSKFLFGKTDFFSEFALNVGKNRALAYFFVQARDIFLN